MIQIYKLNENDKDVLKNLEKVEPWWNKKIDPKIKKAKKFVTKFGLNPNDYIVFDSIVDLDFNLVIKGVNNYLNFFTPKLKLIVSNRDAFKKFDDAIINYMRLNGNVAGVVAIAQFYQSIKGDELIKLNKLNAIAFANEVIEKKWKRYEKEVLETFGGNNQIKDNLKKVFDEVVEFKEQIFDARVALSWVVKYASRLFKVHEITEKQFLNVMYFSYLQLNYNDGFIQVYKNFIYSLEENKNV